MRIVVTGATSMIGVALIKICIENNCEVLAIVRKNTIRIDRIPDSSLINIEYADMDNFADIQGDGRPYDAFYHFAWQHTEKAERDYPVMQEENIHFTLRAVQLADKLGCKTFIGAGSQAEYGPVDGVISADTIPNPVTAYGMAKLSAAMMSRRLCEQLGIKHIWGRIFSVYGVNDNDDTMLSYAICQFKKGECAKFSAATQVWNYLNEDDAGYIFYLFGEKDVDGGIYCVANKESRVLRDYIEELRDILGGEMKCEFTAFEPKGKIYGIKADIKKTIHATGFIPQISFREGIGKIINAISISR